MAYLTFVGTNAGGSDTFASGISDLVSYQSEAGARVASISGDGQWIEIRDPNAGMQLVQQVFVAGAEGLYAPGQLAWISQDGVSQLVSYGPEAAPLVYHHLDDAGQISTSVVMAVDAGRVGVYLRVPQGDDALVFTASQDTGVLSYWQENTQGAWGHATEIDLGGDLGARTITDLAHVNAHGHDWVASLSATDHSISLLRITEDGDVHLADRLDYQDGLPISTPTVVEVATVGGQTYLIMAAAGSSSVTTFRLEPGGDLSMIDQVANDGTTRFESVDVLEVVTVEDRVFVLAAGANDGVTLLTMLPDGRLLHLETLADDAAMALTNVANISAVRIGDALHISLSGSDGVQVTGLRLDLAELGGTFSALGSDVDLTGGTGDDILVGNGAANHLTGGGGDDILVDGKGRDVLFGGAGADIFVFTKDGQRDEIRDFELGVDRIDLSAMGRLYTRDAFEFQSTSDGVKIIFADEELQITTYDGGALDRLDFTDADLLDLSHTELGNVAQADQDLIGTGTRDVLQGGTGDDVLRGEAVRPVFDTPAGQVTRVYLATLDRAPGLEGHRDWTAQLASGALDLDGVIAGFVNSREFQDIYGQTTNAEFVTLLYQNVLGRAPGEAGLANWTQALDSGASSREQVVAGFSESAEFRDVARVDALQTSFAAYQADYVDDVYRLFQATLGRAPNTSGLLDWARQMAEGTEYVDVATGFVNSREFQDAYGSTNDVEFVTLLFQNVLGRAPNASGLDYWVGRLSEGIDTREEVVRGFAQSREFRTGTEATLTTYIRSIGEDDRLEGGAGSDVLFGGALSDTFVFAAFEGGNHTLADLERWDHIELQGFGYAAGAEALDYFAQSGGDVIFEDQGVRVTFLDQQLMDITEDMIALL